MRKLSLALVFSTCLTLVAISISLIFTPVSMAALLQTCTANCRNGTTVSCTGTISCRAINGFGCVAHNRNIPDVFVECP